MPKTSLPLADEVSMLAPCPVRTLLTLPDCGCVGCKENPGFRSGACSDHTSSYHGGGLAWMPRRKPGC